MTRHIRLEGVENFRDYGDYATAAGKRLRSGRLYRSASHGRATDADLAVIDGLNLAVIAARAWRGSRRVPQAKKAFSPPATTLERPFSIARNPMLATSGLSMRVAFW